MLCHAEKAKITREMHQNIVAVVENVRPALKYLQQQHGLDSRCDSNADDACFVTAKLGVQLDKHDFT